MTHIATQRIKKNGKYYGEGDPITLTKDEVKELPTGAVRSDDGETEADKEPMSEEEQATALKDAVAALKPADFKQDGEIRAGALTQLNKTLGFDVTVEAIAAVQASTEGA